RRARRVRRAHRAGRAGVHELRVRARRGADGPGRGGGAGRAARDRGQGGAPQGGASGPGPRGTRLRPCDGGAIRHLRSRTPAPAFLAHAFGLHPPAWVSLRELGARIERLYATGLFANVRYRLEQGELTLLITERSAGRFGLGLRYDSRYKASVLLTGARGGVELDARLGQQIRVGLGAAQALGDA